MRQNRSADPWSTFLTTSGRGGPGGNAIPSVQASGEPVHGDPERADTPGLTDDSRRVLRQLDSAGAPQSIEQIHHATGLGLLEVADAVEALRDRGLVRIEREIDEIVHRTGGSGPV